MRALAYLALVGCASPSVPASKRTNLQRADLSIAGREVVQVRVDFDPGFVSQRHRHPGEEVIYVLEGTIEYQVGEAAPVRYVAGQALTVPREVFHTARNVGHDNAAELATYIVDQNVPLIRLD
jgi:quercetin dioxygenase-like cupin family protein